MSDGMHIVRVPVTFTISAVPPTNAAPIANPDAYTVSGTTLDVAAPGPFGNDTDADGDTLRPAVVGPNGGGAAMPGESLVIDTDGALHYVAPTGFAGLRYWWYKVSDGFAESGYAIITFTVTASPAPNAAPVAGADAYAVDHEATLAIAAPGLLGNDTDGDGDPLAVAATWEPAGGLLPGEALAVLADGSFAYTPPTGFTGTREFRYAATDGTASSAQATLTFTVGAPPAGPMPSAPTPTTPPGPGLPTLPGRPESGGGDASSLAATGVDGSGAAGAAAIAGILVALGILVRRLARRTA